jgi:hypothetical protein
VPDGRPAWDDGSEPAGDLLEGGAAPRWWHSRVAALPPVGRRLAAAVALLAVVVVLVGVGMQWWRDRAVERELMQRVDIATSVGVWSSSSSPKGGSVGYFVVVRNDGPYAVEVESLAAAGGGMRLRMRGDDSRRIAAGEEIIAPLSVLLSCRPGARTPAWRFEADVRVRRIDGSAANRRVELADAASLFDVADTICRFSPGLVDKELSGPVYPGT